MNTNTIINIEEIEEMFREECKERNIKFSKTGFVKFLNFFGIDSYDWVRGNLRYYFREEHNKKEILISKEGNDKNES